MTQTCCQPAYVNLSQYKLSIMKASKISQLQGRRVFHLLQCFPLQTIATCYYITHIHQPILILQLWMYSLLKHFLLCPHDLLTTTLCFKRTALVPLYGLMMLLIPPIRWLKKIFFYTVSQVMDHVISRAIDHQTPSTFTNTNSPLSRAFHPCFKQWRGQLIKHTAVQGDKLSVCN
jgi:hypothetical protein